MFNRNMSSVQLLCVLALLAAAIITAIQTSNRKARASKLAEHDGNLGVLKAIKQARSQDNRPPSSPQCLTDVLKSNELFHGLNEIAVAEYGRRFELLELREGVEVQRPETYAMAFVVHGRVQVLFRGAEIQAKVNGTWEVPSSKKHLFKSIKAGQAVVSPLETLAEIIDSCTEDDEGYADTTDELASGSITFVAAEHSELAVLTKDKFREEIKRQQHTLFHFIDAALRRLYFSTLPIASRYLGLGEEITNFGKTMLARTAIPPDDQAILRKQLDHMDRQNLFGMFKPLSLRDLKRSSTASDFNVPTTMQNRRRPIVNTRRLSKTSAPSKLRIQIPEHDDRERVLSPPTAHLRSALSKVEGLEFTVATPMESEPSLLSLTQTVRRSATSLLLHCLGLMPDSSSIAATNEDDHMIQHNALIDSGELVFVSQGTKLVRQGKRYPAVFLLVDGQLRADLRNQHGSSGSQVDDASFPINRGTVVGSDSLLPNNRSLFDIVAVTDVYLAVITRSKIHSILSDNPSASVLLANNVLQSLSPLLRLVDFSTTWKPYEAYQVLDHDPLPSHSVVLSGRLRITDCFGKRGEEVSREIGAGDSFGVLDQQPYGHHNRRIRSVRKTQITQMQLSSFEALAYRFPPLAFRFMNAILGNPSVAPISTIEGPRDHSKKQNVQTVAIISISLGLNGEEWSGNLISAVEYLKILGKQKTATITSKTLQRSLSPTSGTKVDSALLENYLAQVEDSAKLVLYVANLADEASWAQTCIAHADMVLFIASAASTPDVSSEEKGMLAPGIAARTMLVLVNGQDRQDSAGSAVEWLKERHWISEGVQHVLLPSGKDRPHSKQRDLLATTSADFQRVARRIFNKSIALVLGGGGARGVSHLGVLRALEERSIPVDVVGGCSIGSFVGGVYAKELDANITYNIVRDLCTDLRPWRFLLDFTYPWLSVTSGARFNRLIKRTFKPGMDLVDTRIEYYCGVTNLSKHAATQVLTYGSAWKSIRSSMSFLGFVPPMTDRNGDLLLDGCYSSNLPVARAAEHVKPDLILAVDVGPELDLPKYSWGETYSAWQMAYKRFFNPSQRDDLPRPYSWVEDCLTYSRSLADIEVTKSEVRGCEYTKMPLGDYTALSFADFDEIYNIGYAHATKWLDELEAKGVFDKLAIRR